MGERYSMLPDLRCNSVNILRSADDETYMMDALNRVGNGAGRKLMNGEIVGAQSQISVIFIWNPFNLHAEHSTIEIDGFPDIADVESDMPKT